MTMNEPRKYKELTADILSERLAELVENAEADKMLAIFKDLSSKRPIRLIE